MPHLKTEALEANFDAIVGPTHNYSGLSFGNVASVKNKQAISNPKQAALQGLAKMKYLADLGLIQGIIPPQERPHIPTLRTLGFTGSDEQILASAMKHSPHILFACASASSMWAANAATISPSSDSADGKVHISIANLSSKLHRSIEPPITGRLLQAIFPDSSHFIHHPPLLAGSYLTDEGAANHTRFCSKHGSAGVQLFVYGKHASSTQEMTRYPARQSLEASQAIARRHLINENQVIFVQQSPEAIDAGVFHNDVISVGHQHLFLYHEQAFVDTENVIRTLTEKLKNACDTELKSIKIEASAVSLSEAVASYLFNSQIVTLPDNSMQLIAPSECADNPRIHRAIENILNDSANPIGSVKYFKLHESMRNGGGPACLRLRVVLTPDEIKATNQRFLLDDALYQTLVAWVNKHYRDQLSPADLADNALLNEVRNALEELTQILQLGSLYDFQK